MQLKLAFRAPNDQEKYNHDQQQWRQHDGQDRGNDPPRQIPQYRNQDDRGNEGDDPAFHG